MLNKNGIRELCYIVTVDDVKPIEGRDRVECAVIGGWTVMVRKDQFKPGDLGVYFEIDSKMPETEPFMFLAQKHFRIKTQKYKTPDGHFFSQGLLMGAEDFGWTLYTDENGTQYIHDDIANVNMPEGTFLTARLGITYAVEEDNKRKAKSVDKYAKMAQRNRELFSRQPYRWLMRRNWGKKLLFIFYGKKNDKHCFPSWVRKTDEERVQNMPWILNDKSAWYATEKIDGTSTTFTMRGWGRKREFCICSRNVNFDTPEKREKGAYYDTNVYVEMAEKYDIKNVLDKLMTHYENIDGNVDFVTLQGETYGEGIQKRDYSLKGHDFAAFNLIIGYKNGERKRLNPRQMTLILMMYDVPCVPIVDDEFVLPDTVEELLEIATGVSKIDGKPREGLVFRSEDGVQSFKAVSNEFLVKYHG